MTATSTSTISAPESPGEVVETATPAIYTSALSKCYRTTTALAGLTMTVPRGEVFGFLGPNGAGKTTAVKLLLGLTRPTSGDGWVLGARIGDRETRRRIGYLPELFRYQDWLTAREVLSLHCKLAGIRLAQRPTQIDEALETVGLENRARDRVGTFSKGMQQRLGLGVALLGTPELVFLDEPTSALDPVGRHDVRGIIRALKERGTAVFLNSHLLSEVEQVCDRVAVINHGEVIAIGSMSELLGDAQVLRIHVTGLAAAESMMQRYGGVETDGDRFTVRGISSNAVPRLVHDLVDAGAQIHAVEPSHDSLEERFLQILQSVEPGEG